MANIGIDCRTISDNQRGFKRLENLLKAAGEKYTQGIIKLFTENENYNKQLNLPTNFEVEDPKKRLRMIHRKGVGLIGKKLFKDIDVMHFPTADIWYSKYTHTVVTLHDIAPLHFPEAFFKTIADEKKYYNHLKQINYNSDVLVTVSNYSRDEISEYFNRSKDSIKVIWQGYDPQFKPIELSEEEKKRIKDNYLINDRFWFYIGGLDVRKNIPFILEVFHDYLVDGGKVRQLVIAGVSNLEEHNLYPDLSKITEDLRITDFVHFTGYIPDEDAVYLMNMATGFLYPSAMEGFGYPPLEAMACGTPLICSNAASLPEVVEDGGILCPPDDPQPWLKAMTNISENPDPGLRESALKQADKFNWKTTAQEFWNIYETIP